MNRSRLSPVCHVGLASCLALGLGLASCATTDLEIGGAPPAPPTAQAETRSVVDRVQMSGKLPDDASTVQDAADFALKGTFGPSTSDAETPDRAECFVGGCLQHVIYRDQCAAQSAGRLFTDSAKAPLHRWPGPVYQSPAVLRSDGRLDVTRALFVSDPRDKRLLEVLKPVEGPPAIRLDVCRGTGNQPAPANPKMPEAK